MYVGIDLGTTNSAIASFDGAEVKVYKSPEQNTVTPSAIYIDRRARFYGARAYDKAAFSPDNVVLRFKRFIGSGTPIAIPAVELVLSAEECSAEILRYLFGYLPDRSGQASETGTVITVPAAFDQNQRDATLAAAELAGIGKVALMQEPVAAVMTIMKTARQDGMFVVYDLGGGTFDVAVAESTGGSVALLDHGGMSMCGGRDFDRTLVDKTVVPWLRDQFSLPENLNDGQYRRLLRLVEWATEKAKIQLSLAPKALVSLSEDEIRMQDLGGRPIYVDVSIDRLSLDKLIRDRLDATVDEVRLALSRTSLQAGDVERVVFVGGPTQFKLLREYVCSQLGIPEDTRIDPMTAVAEGAAVFAESIDWASTRARKNPRGSTAPLPQLGLRFEFLARTAEPQTKIAARCEDTYLTGEYFQVDSIDTGWSSGQRKLHNGAEVEVALPQLGAHTFAVRVISSSGNSPERPDAVLTITRTSATIQAIPASHSIGVEVKESLYGSATKIRYLVKKGDLLPMKGKMTFKAAEQLAPGSDGSLVFKLYEGETPTNVADNRFVGCFKIRGDQLEAAAIKPGDDLQCEYEVADSGRISIMVTVPSVGGSFVGYDLYSRQEVLQDYSKAASVVEREAAPTLERIQQLELRLEDPELQKARQRLDHAHQLSRRAAEDSESGKEAIECLHQARMMLSRVHQRHLAIVRQAELDSAVDFFERLARDVASPGEGQDFDNMHQAASRLIGKATGEFDNVLDKMREAIWVILLRQDAFIEDRFEQFRAQPELFPDTVAYDNLVERGRDALARGSVEDLRDVVLGLYRIKVTTPWSDHLGLSNIM